MQIRFKDLLGLGWLRLFLSLMVFDAHYWIYRTHVFPHFLKVFPTLAQSRAPGMGAIAVIGFFVISGYVIALVMNEKNEYKDNLGPLIFYLNRALRIYPLFLFILFLSTVVFFIYHENTEEAGFLELKRFVGTLFLFPIGLYTILMSPHRVMWEQFFFEKGIGGVVWSISYDLIFYIVSPIIFFDARRTLNLFFLSILYLFSLLFLFHDKSPDFWFFHIYTNGFFVFGCFISGGVVYHYFEKQLDYLGLVGFMTIIYFAYFPIYTPNTILCTAIIMIAFMLVVATLSQHKSKLDSFWGEMTYATYLTHFPLLFVLLKYFQERSWSIILIGLVLTYSISYVLLLFLENPMESYRHRKINRIFLIKNQFRFFDKSFQKKLTIDFKNKSLAMFCFLILLILMANNLNSLIKECPDQKRPWSCGRHSLSR
jgi:peptidoglycan/LPS O-acetylase OafA/YrhL